MGAQHSHLVGARGVAEPHLHEETIHLCLRQWVRACEIQWVLRRQHQERLGQLEALALHGDLPFLHGLQQS
jgi:hypothetical protein